MFRVILFSGAALLPCLAMAQPVVGPYVSLGAGAVVQEHEIVKQDLIIPIVGNHSYSFDTGAVGQVSIGYGIGYGLRFEVEGDYVHTDVDGHGPNATPQRVNGTEQKWGGFGNVLYDFDFGLPVYPYIGAGFGGQVVEHDRFYSQSVNADLLPVYTNSQSKGQYAYQGIAGVAFPLPFLPGLSATVDYRFVGIFDPVGPYDGFTVNRFHPAGIPTQRKFSNDLNNTFMVGLRYALFQPAPPPPPAQQTANPPPAPEAARTYLVFFDWDRADLTARARQIVAEAASASTHVATTRLEVNGYTDLSGTAAYNQRLSVRRAKSVEAELVRDGVPGGEISIHGYGESNPLVPTAAGVREPQNRRVEIILK